MYGTAGEPWMRWGWCYAQEMAGLINNHFNTNWDELELISRFGLQKQTAMQVHKFGLRILEVPNAAHHNDCIRGNFQLRNYNADLLLTYQGLKPQNPPFWVPAGWAKEVMWALGNGGRRIIMDKFPGDPPCQKKAVVVADEKGEGIFYL